MSQAFEQPFRFSCVALLYAIALFNKKNPSPFHSILACGNKFGDHIYALQIPSVVWRLPSSGSCRGLGFIHH